ncbi:hypothetical protein BsWGS_08021 [Bradybaena similaris]
MCWTKRLGYGQVTVKPQHIPFFGLYLPKSGSRERMGQKKNSQSVDNDDEKRYITRKNNYARKDARKKESRETSNEMDRRGGEIDTDEPYQTRTNNKKQKCMENPNLEGHQESQATRRNLERE